MTKPKIRIRTRDTSIDASRIIAECADQPRKKRQPNSGSMKPGETRNPNGRPKGAKGVKTIVRRVLHETTEIRTATGKRKVTIYEALLQKELQRASEGDWRARKTLIELGRWALPEENPEKPRQSSEPVTEADAAIIDWFADQIRTGDAAGKDEQ